MKILHALCLASFFMANQSHAIVVLSVNTTNDENGENTANCSLREAVQAINTQTAFGGCAAGQRFGTNRIVLENATYFLSKGELIITREMSIVGANTNNKELVDRVLGIKPSRMPPTTTIDGNFKRILNTTSIDDVPVTLTNLILKHGKAEKGGAILAGGRISTNNTIFTDNEASMSGGAVFLSGRNAGLTSNDTTFTRNKAALGAVLNMSCDDHLSLVSRTVTIIRGSIIENGASDNSSVIYACGNTDLSINASTIAQNTAKSDGGIVYFADSLGKESGLNITFTTIVENKIAPALSYGKLNSLSLNTSIIAFNDAGCSTKVGSSELYKSGNISGGLNTLQNCVITYSSNEVTRPDINLNNPSNADAQFVTELHPLANYGGYTKSYLPRTSSKYIINKAAASGETTCDRLDQRSSSSPSDSPNKCDVGSVERLTANAVFDIAKTINNKDESDRIAEVDIFSNDIPSESENSRGSFAKDPVTGLYLITLTENANNRCSVVHRDNDQTPLMRFDNKGVPISDEETAVLCKYKFTDTNGNTSNEGELRFKTVNKQPIATNDSFTLASGQPTVSLDLLANDNDKNDGIYGGLCTDASNVKCNGFYIRVVSSPKTGVIEAEKTGNCPDYDDSNKYKCYGGNITYRANNVLSPFNDKFTYVVYDIDKTASNEATVTIINETGVNEENNSGGLGLLSIFGLTGLAFYRRFRKSYVA